MKATDIKTIHDLIKYEYGDRVVNRVLYNKFSNIGRVHDWRNYVDSEYKELWPQLPDDVKLAVFYGAESQANQEEWD